MFSLAEDLTLLLLDDDSGKSVVKSMVRDRAVAGAALLDLINGGQVSPAGPEEQAKQGTLVVRDSSLTGSAVLDHVLGRLAGKKPMKPSRAVEFLVKGTRDAVQDQLVERGLLHRESRTVLGIFPVTRWPAADREHEAQVRAKIDAAMRQGETPDPHIAALISLVHAARSLKKVLGEDSWELQARAKEISEGSWAFGPVREAIDSVHAALLASAMTTAAAASS